MDDLNGMLISLEASLSQNQFERKWLIIESFMAWYKLVEGDDCENFSEGDIRDILMRNTDIYHRIYAGDADYSFIIGWMLTVAFWYFEPLFKEEDGARLLNTAYRANPKNSLFKWALRQPLRLSDSEIENLKIDIHLRFDQLFNYGEFLKDYFLDII